MDVNNYYMGTKSQKLYRVSPLKRYIVDKIDNNQNIKRLCRYMTKTPTYNKGMTYSNQLIKQPDLKDSLLYPVKTDKEATIQDYVLFPYAFTEDVLADKRLTIYVHSPRSLFNINAANNRPNYGLDELLGKHLFLVEVVYPTEYNEISPYGQERANLIACEILNMLDGLKVDDELQAIVGECVFKVEGEITDLRLSKAGYMILTIPIWTTVTGVRTDQITDH